MDIETIQLGTFYYTYLVGKIIIQNTENNILCTDNIQKKLVIRKKAKNTFSLKFYILLIFNHLYK